MLQSQIFQALQQKLHNSEIKKKTPLHSPRAFEQNKNGR